MFNWLLTPVPVEVNSNNNRKQAITGFLNLQAGLFIESYLTHLSGVHLSGKLWRTGGHEVNLCEGGAGGICINVAVPIWQLKHLQLICIITIMVMMMMTIIIIIIII